ncbi:MAG: sodium-dependent bicarbonate transport family permease [Actinobacteria bacterium]|nr:sodium-dependent bicarbonate transport family permease [Actinomycetota bacterium]
MSISDLVSLNLESPVVLAFLLGVIAAFIKSDLRFPEQVTSLLSTYLLFAIGLKGGLRLRESSVSELAWPVVITLILGVATPLVAFIVARAFVRLDTINAASLAAHYGSVSAVTFTAAESFARAAGTLEEGFLPALVAVLEIPGIVVALVIASRARQVRSMSSAIHEVLTGKSVVLLLGGLIIGTIANQEALTRVEPFFIGLFQGLLCLFLLDLGTLAGQRFNSIRRAGARLLVFATVLPIVFGVIGVFLASLVGMSEGGATVLAAMAASASYIAAPAAVRVGLPEADIGVSLGAALGVTFPFNLIIGIPLYSEIASALI